MINRLATIAAVLLVRLAMRLVHWCGAFTNPWPSAERFNDAMKRQGKPDRIDTPWQWAAINGQFNEVRDMLKFIAEQPVLPWESLPEPLDDEETKP